MIYTVCVGKLRDNNNAITQYKLRDFYCQETIFDPTTLKDYISKGKLSVCNLTLTSDNKLVEKKVESLSEIPNDFGKVQHLQNMNNNQNNNVNHGTHCSMPNERNVSKKQIDMDNAHKQGEFMYYVDAHNELKAKHIPSNTEDVIASKVDSVCFVPFTRNLFMFVGIKNDSEIIYKYIVYDTQLGKISREKEMCRYAGGYVGKKLPIQGDSPYYKDINNEFLFVPIRKLVDDHIETVGILSLFVKEFEPSSNYIKDINTARSISYFMEGLRKAEGNILNGKRIYNNDDSVNYRMGNVLFVLNKKLQIAEACRF
jgi:hypothetical protein